MICQTLRLYVFLKVGNKDKSFISSLREFHSLMDARIEDLSRDT